MRIMVRAEMGRGIITASTMARLDTLPTGTWLGTRKKNTDADTMAVATVMESQSQAISHSCFAALLSYPVSPPQPAVIAVRFLQTG